MDKAPDAFRTISEVAEWLDRPTHVLRFWESKFPQVKPVKRAGGRRYYRRQDMLLLGGIKRLLHDDGMTIKGVQKLLREQGVAHVTALSQPLDDDIAEQAQSPSPVPLDRSGPAPMIHTEAPDAEGEILLFPAPVPRAGPGETPAPEARNETSESAEEKTAKPVEETVPHPADDPAAEIRSGGEPVAEPTGTGVKAPPARPSETASDLPRLPSLADLDALDLAPGLLSRVLSRRAPLPKAQRAALAAELPRLKSLARRIRDARGR